jgi:hypothetical protein
MVTRRSLVFAILVTVSASAGCRELAQPGQASDLTNLPARNQLVFVYDRSISIQDHELEHARALTSERVGRLDYGDRVVAIELLQQALDEEPRRWATQVPERQFQNQVVPRDAVVKERFIQDIRDYIEAFSNPEDRDNIGGTDILSTLHLVGSELRARPDYRTTFVLFSDMLQANQVMNLEGLTRMPSDNWIQQEAARGTLPDLSGLCVVLVGARKDTQISQIVHDFWLEYFEVTGATLVDQNYTYRPVQLPDQPCG